MSLHHLLLGVTRDGATGYDIKRAFDEGLQHIWDAELSQIYPALQRLEKQGLLTSAKVAGERGAAKRIYRLSPEGENVLRHWLRSDPLLHDERHPFLVQLCLLGDVAELPQTLKYFNALQSVALARLQTMECLEEKWRRADPSYPEVRSARDFHIQMTLEFGLSSTRAMLRCCKSCIKRVRQRLEILSTEAEKDE